jgi:hypothetical protein
MKNILPLLLIVLFYCNKTSAQYNYKGKVIDAKTNQPIESVLISSILNEKNEKTITNENGSFSLKSTFEKDSLEISSIGYENKKLFTVANEDIKIILEPKALSLADVTIKSSKFSKLNVIGKVDLKLKPVVSSQELLRIVPGLFIAQHAGGGKAEQIFLRGFDLDHGTDINITVDGIPVNMVSHAHGQGYADAHFIIPETVNNIDFGTGSYYANQGNLTTAGYVAFATHKTINKSFIQTEIGGFGTKRTVAMFDLFKQNKSLTNAYVAGEYYYFDGPTINKQALNRVNVFSKFNTTLSQHTSISLSASAFKSNWNASGQLPQRAIESGLVDRFGSLDPSEGGNTERYNFNAIVTSYFNNNATLTNQLYYTKYHFNLFSNFTFFLNDSINGDEINQSENRNIIGFTSKYNNKKYINNIIPLESEYAAGFRFDNIQDNNLSNAVKRSFNGHIKLGDIKELNTFFYTNQQISFNKLSVNVGARVDLFSFSYLDKLVKNSSFQSETKAIVSPKLNIQYTFNNKVQSYLKLGKGFHSNDTRVVVSNEGKDILPSAYGIDLGFVLKPSQNFYINFALWMLQSNQEFVYVGDDGNIEPSGKSIRRGIDIITRYQINKNLFLNNNFNYSYARSLDALPGENYIPLAPSFTASGSLIFKQQKGINASLNYRTIANRAANEDNSIIAKGYFLADANISYSKNQFEFGFSVENIFNSTWNEAQFATTSRLQHEIAPETELNFTPGNPRFGKFKISYSF